MSDPKGKGKATAELPKDDGVPAPSSIKNFVSNVASSASGLARSAFAAPSDNELKSTASSGLLGVGKAQASASGVGSSAWAEASKPTTFASSGAAQAQSSQPQGLRTAQGHAQASEAEFSSFLDGIPSMEADMSALNSSGSIAFPAETALPTTYQPQPTQHVDDQSRSASRHIDPFRNEEFIRFSAHQPDHLHMPSQSELSDKTYSTVADAQAHDGADVLAILDTFTSQTLDYFEPQTIEQEVDDWHLTQEQSNLAKKLADELHLRPSPDHPSNLLPQVFQNGEKEEYLPEDYAFDSHSHLGSVLPSAEAKDKWVEQWDSVLNRYQDEVWGGMAPLVKEAKKELEEMKLEGTEGRQPKALARLGLVLGHISGNQSQIQQPLAEKAHKEKERHRLIF